MPTGPAGSLAARGNLRGRLKYPVGNDATIVCLPGCRAASTYVLGYRSALLGWYDLPSSVSGRAGPERCGRYLLPSHDGKTTGQGAARMNSTHGSRGQTPAQRRARDADALIAAARAGDAGAFGRLVQRFRPRIYALALHLSGSPADADDIAQDAFEQAYRHLACFEGRSQLFTWLYRIAVHRALDAQRARKRAGLRLNDVRVEAALQVDAPGDPRRALELRQTYAALLQGLDTLAPTLRSAVVLTALQGLSYREAAAVLGTSEGAIAVRIHTSRKHLRAALEAATRPAGRKAMPDARLSPELALALASVL